MRRSIIIYGKTTQLSSLLYLSGQIKRTSIVMWGLCTYAGCGGVRAPSPSQINTSTPAAVSPPSLTPISPQPSATPSPPPPSPPSPQPQATPSPPPTAPPGGPSAAPAGLAGPPASTCDGTRIIYDAKSLAGVRSLSTACRACRLRAGLVPKSLNR